MSSPHAATSHSLAIFHPPYERVLPCGPEAITRLGDVDHWKGHAVLWVLDAAKDQMAHYELLRGRPIGLPLFVLLPPPTFIASILDLLPLVRSLSPRMILPHGLIDTPSRLKQILATAPPSVPGTLTNYMIKRGLLRKRKATREFQKIVELAPETRSISALSRRMYTSRRTLGRHFVSTGIPVPSHCLHFARLFHIAVQLQSDECAMFRIASRFGYSDGFTMSNQMKRLIGYRPTDVRSLLGWEWVVEAWLKQERRGG